MRPALTEALATTLRLHHTVEELLRLSRPHDRARASAGTMPVAALVREVRERWHGLFALDGRRLECDVGDAPSDARVAGRPVSEVLGILLDNARVHGRGSVGVVVRDLEGALAFDVSDEGRIEGEAARLFDRGHTEGGSGTGIGLALARDLAAAVGGKLSLKSNVPATFTLLVPVRHDDNQRGASTAR